jgi:type 2 lantibiotic biosynthesis protein LanM
VSAEHLLGNTFLSRPPDPSDRAAVPFARVFHPLIEEACSRLRARCGNTSETLSSDAHITLEHSLLRILSAVCGQVLELGFSLFRFHHDPLRMSSVEPLLNCEIYDNFVDKILKGNLARIFTEYPALQDLVKVCTDQWISATAEFLDRLQADRTNITAFFCGEDLGAVIGIETDLSDRHDGGRTVIALQFASGLRLVYKPKDLGSEEAYFSILNWFNHEGVPLDFRTLRVLPRDGYGWVEYIEQRPCQSAEEARRYYCRAGQLSCVIYVLAGVDCHFDNLIACGEYPVLVDTEMLFQPVLTGDRSSDAGTVLRTGLLPKLTAEGSDFSGLGCVSNQGTRFRIPEWGEANSDAMTLRFRAATITPRGNVPMLGCAPLSPLDYVDPMIEGFRKMYRYMLIKRKRLLDPEGPLACVATQKIRILARGTLEYYLVLSRALHPKSLRTAGCLKAEFQNHSRFPFLEPLEVAALRQMDVPRFMVEASARSLATANVADATASFSQSGFERVISEIGNLSEAHLSSQVKLIKSAWAFSGLSRISTA